MLVNQSAKITVMMTVSVFLRNVCGPSGNFSEFLILKAANIITNVKLPLLLQRHNHASPKIGSNVAGIVGPKLTRNICIKMTIITRPSNIFGWGMRLKPFKAVPMNAPIVGASHRWTGFLIQWATGNTITPIAIPAISGKSISFVVAQLQRQAWE